MRISDWSSDVCSSDLPARLVPQHGAVESTLEGAAHFLHPVEKRLEVAAARVARTWPEAQPGVVQRLEAFAGQRGADCPAVVPRLFQTGDERAWVALVAGEEMRDHLPGGGGEKIGRASCGERGCPYV